MTLNKFLQKWRPSIQPEAFEAMVTDLQEMMKPPEEGKLYYESTVSHRDMRPLVSFRFGKYQFQLSPSAVREMAVNLLRVAHAAELDSYVFQFFCGENNLPMEQIGQMVAHFRHWREQNEQINEAASEIAKQ